MSEEREEGFLKKAESIISIGQSEQGTPLRPLIKSARESATSFLRSSEASVTSLSNDLSKNYEQTIGDRIDTIKPSNDTIYTGARIRPDLKFAAVVGLTALVSSRFGFRAFARNTAVVSFLSGAAFFPDSMARGWDKTQNTIRNSISRS